MTCDDFKSIFHKGPFNVSRAERAATIAHSLTCKECDGWLRVKCEEASAYLLEKIASGTLSTEYVNQQLDKGLLQDMEDMGDQEFSETIRQARRKRFSSQ